MSQPWTVIAMKPHTSLIGISDLRLDGTLEGTPEIGPISAWLRSADPPDRVFAAAGLTAPQALAALAVYGLEANDGLGPPLVTANPKLPESRRFLDEALRAEALPGCPRTLRLVLAAGLFQIYDFWDASHEAAQQAGDMGENRYSATWHAICHRREPDAGNAGYWLARARHNPAGGRLAEMIEADQEQLELAVRPLAARLARNGTFQDRAMVELCCRASPPEAERLLLRRVQKLEMALLIGAALEELK